MSLMRLPNELLVIIAERSVNCMLTISGLIWCNSRLYHLLIKIFYRHIQDCHTAYYAMARSAGYGGHFGRVKDRALSLIIEAAYYPPGITDFPEAVGRVYRSYQKGAEAKAYLKSGAILKPQAWVSLTDLTATGNPLTEMLISADSHMKFAKGLLSWWIHPSCLLPPPVDYVRSLKSIARHNNNIVEVLTKYGVDVDLRANELRKAICDEDESLVESLLKQGVGRTFPSLNTFFSQAIPTGNARLVELLLQHNVKPCPEDDALTGAIRTGNEKMVELFLKCEIKPSDHNQTLAEALLTENPRLVELLFEYDLKPCRSTPQYRAAVTKGNAGLVEVLNKYGFQPRSTRGLLKDAIRAGSAEVVKLLLEYGVKPNASDRAMATLRTPDIHTLFQEWTLKQKDSKHKQKMPQKTFPEQEGRRQTRSFTRNKVEITLEYA